VVRQQVLRRIARSTGRDFQFQVRWDLANFLPLCETFHRLRHTRTTPVPHARIAAETFAFAESVGPEALHELDAYPARRRQRQACRPSWPTIRMSCRSDLHRLLPMTTARKEARPD
jgi:hypothetical protein